MNTSVISDEEYIPEHIIQSVVAKATKLYDTPESRLQYCAMILGKDNITNPEVFYYHYFERHENVSQ